MNFKIKKILVVILLASLGFLIAYTGFMSVVFSIGGDMWKSDTEFMIGYVGIFILSSMSLIFMVRTQWFKLSI